VGNVWGYRSDWLRLGQFLGTGAKWAIKSLVRADTLVEQRRLAELAQEGLDSLEDPSSRPLSRD